MFVNLGQVRSITCIAAYDYISYSNLFMILFAANFGRLTRSLDLTLEKILRWLILGSIWTLIILLGGGGVLIAKMERETNLKVKLLDACLGP
jgi:hypothetical protein